MSVMGSGVITPQLTLPPGSGVISPYSYRLSWCAIESKRFGIDAVDHAGDLAPRRCDPGRPRRTGQPGAVDGQSRGVTGHAERELPEHNDEHSLALVAESHRMTPQYAGSGTSRTILARVAPVGTPDAQINDRHHRSTDVDGVRRAADGSCSAGTKSTIGGRCSRARRAR
jgi:hypothetical protein